MENNYGELLMEIAKILQAKYRHMTEVQRLTEEMAEALSRDDRVSVQMILNMRGGELEKLIECDKKIFLFRESVPPAFRGWLVNTLKGKGNVDKPEGEYGKEGAVVMRLSSNIRRVWEKTMVVDRHMNKRLAGKDSFYAQESIR